MSKRNIFVGIFLTAAVALLGAGLFLIGNQHRAFRDHVEFYTEFANLEGIAKGAKVRVDGMDGGQVENISIPSKPSEKFRLKMQLDERLHGLIRNDSVVTISTEGIVGDKFLLIHEGKDESPEAAAKSTLPSKEPFQISKLLDQAQGIMGQAGSTITDLRGRLDGTLDAVTKTVNNTNGVVTNVNGVVTDIRHGRGTAGVLLEDPVTAGNVKQAVLNTKVATANLDTATGKVNDLLTDFQSHQLFDRAQQTIDNANSAAKQLNQVTTEVHTTLQHAFAEDQYGNTAGGNLRQSLTNLNHASGNLAEDTAALKQEFFFRGFFKRRGYDDLSHIPAAPYREGKLFKKLDRRRAWFTAASLFTLDPQGEEIVSPQGRADLDRAVAQMMNLYSTPIILEGYSGAATGAEQLIQSRHRAALVRAYLQVQFHIEPKDIGIIALRDQPPENAGKNSWNGLCLVEMVKPK